MMLIVVLSCGIYFMCSSVDASQESYVGTAENNEHTRDIWFFINAWMNITMKDWTKFLSKYCAVSTLLLTKTTIIIIIIICVCVWI